MLLRLAFVLVLLLTDTTIADILQSRSEELYIQPSTDPAVEFDQWIWPISGLFSTKHCRIKGIYNRRTVIRRGECHVDVTSPEEHGCKTVWAPLCQFLPGWWQTMIAGHTDSWKADEFFSKSFSEQQWLIEREITLMHVAARRSRCAYYSTSKESRTLRDKRFFDSENSPTDHCPLPQQDRWDLVDLLASAEQEMEAKGIENPTGSSPKGELDTANERSVDVFQLDNGLCPATGDHLCFLGRRRYEICPETAE